MSVLFVGACNSVFLVIMLPLTLATMYIYVRVSLFVLLVVRHMILCANGLLRFEG